MIDADHRNVIVSVELDNAIVADRLDIQISELMNATGSVTPSNQCGRFR